MGRIATAKDIEVQRPCLVETGFKARKRHMFGTERLLCTLYLTLRDRRGLNELRVTKRELAGLMDAKRDSIDRACSQLRREGFIETSTVEGRNRQVACNSYRVTDKGRRAASALLDTVAPGLGDGREGEDRACTPSR